jgi:hypothetical protein
VKIEDLKQAVAELLTERIDMADFASGHGSDFLDDMERKADREMERERNTSEWERLSSKERQTLLWIVKAVPKMTSVPSFEKMVEHGASQVGADVGDWPIREKPWRGDIKFDPVKAAAWVCGLVAQGGMWGGAAKAECPPSWNVKGLSNPTATDASAGSDSSAGGNWFASLEEIDQRVLNKLQSMLVNKEIVAKTSFDELVAKAAAELKPAVDVATIAFMKSGTAKETLKRKFMSTLKPKFKSLVAETKNKKKRGFGEGEPPEEEIYKKREVVQEADLEAPDAAKEMGDAAKEMGDAALAQGDAGEELSGAQEEAAKAAGERKEASQVWRDAGKLKIAAVDAAEKHADKEGKATDAAEKAASAAQDASKAAEAAAAEKQKALDVARKAHEQEQKAAAAVESAAEAEQAALDGMADGQKDMSDATSEFGDAETEFGETAPEFGDTLASDEEARSEEEEEREEEREDRDTEAEDAKAEDEAEAEVANAEREAADKEAAAEAEAEKESEDEEEPEEEEDEEAIAESTMHILKSMIRKEYQALTERKWGDKGKPSPKETPISKDNGLTADDLRGMVLKTMMAGEEERDVEMIKLLKDMLASLKSIEYHTTPEKGALSKHSQTAAGQWLNEGVQENVLEPGRKAVREMRKLGMDKHADLHENFLRWLSECGELPDANVKGSVDDEIADLKAILVKMGAKSEEEYALDKQMAEVPGHHN